MHTEYWCINLFGKCPLGGLRRWEDNNKWILGREVVRMGGALN
jgi:hypothetical protein